MFSIPCFKLKRCDVIYRFWFHQHLNLSKVPEVLSLHDIDWGCKLSFHVVNTDKCLLTWYLLLFSGMHNCTCLMITNIGSNRWCIRIDASIVDREKCDDSVVFSAGLRTMVQPTAKGGLTLEKNMMVGKFQGIICPTTLISSFSC